MLGRIILIAIQFATAFLGAPYVMAKLPITGDLKLFAQAAVFAILVWIVGLVGSFALKDVNLPSSRTLGSALIGALIGAALTLIPGLLAAIPIKFPTVYLPIIGAILGYMARK